MRKPTLYKHRGYWYVRIWNEIEGKYHAKALGIPVEGKKERRREAEEAAAKLVISITERTTPAPDNAGNIPLLDYVSGFWQTDSEYIREKALLEKKPVSLHYIFSNYRLVETKMRPFPGFSGLTLGTLSKSIIRQWKLWMAEQGISGRMINGALLALRVPVRRAYYDDLIPVDPFAGVPTAAHKEKVRGILTPAEIKKLVNAPVTDHRSRLAVYLSLYCSMRMGEVRGLLWGDISDGIIHICHNWQEKEGLKPCKCGSEGYVPMPKAVAELVNHVYSIAPLTGTTDFVMAITPNHPVSREYLWQALHNELGNIGISKEQRKQRNIVFHSLRHSFVTACRIAGLTDFETMTLSRHKDIKMLQRYSHGDQAIDVKEIGRKFELSLL